MVHHKKLPFYKFSFYCIDNMNQSMFYVFKFFRFLLFLFFVTQCVQTNWSTCDEWIEFMAFIARVWAKKRCHGFTGITFFTYPSQVGGRTKEFWLVLFIWASSSRLGLFVSKNKGQSKSSSEHISLSFFFFEYNITWNYKRTRITYKKIIL